MPYRSVSITSSQMYFFRIKYDYFCVISLYVFEKKNQFQFCLMLVLIIEIDRIHIIYIYWFLFSSGCSIKPTLSLVSSPVFGKRKEVFSDWLTDNIYGTVFKSTVC